MQSDFEITMRAMLRILEWIDDPNGAHSVQGEQAREKSRAELRERLGEHEAAA